MDEQTLKRITELTKQIEGLPKGYISKKIINGKTYFYHQWSENGKLKSIYINESDFVELVSKIEKRRRLKDELNDLKRHCLSLEKPSHELDYLLMHLDIPVAELSFEKQSGVINKVGEVKNSSHLPVGTITSYGRVDPNKLKQWWANRSIPSSRSGIKDVLDTLGIASTTALLRKGYGLSLSDCYWVKPIHSSLSWDSINFFHNEFSEDLGELLMSGAKKGKIDFSSPDSTSVGNLKKRWKIVDGQRVLIKGGSAPFRQEPFNEVVCSSVCELLGFPHVKYELTFIDGYPYSVCSDFVDGNTEFVPAHATLSLFEKRKNESEYSRLLRACKELGIPDVILPLSRMIIFDYIIANEDRHLNNFGFLRDAKSLKWIGVAPLFDNGGSLGFDKLNDEISNNRKIVCKPFKNKHREQI